MATIKRFEDLESWQESRKFVSYIYSLTNNDRFKRDFELVKQIREALFRPWPISLRDFIAIATENS